MVANIQYRDLSRAISHALRHNPEHYGLLPDSEGWVTVGDLLAAFRHTFPQWQNLTETDLKEMIERSDKARHEIESWQVNARSSNSDGEIGGEAK
jgi:putative RNA 2'-phosphotransferase